MNAMMMSILIRTALLVFNVGSCHEGHTRWRYASFPQTDREKNGQWLDSVRYRGMLTVYHIQGGSGAGAIVDSDSCSTKSKQP